eukprot:TRINITY_DN318_c0_g1_i1.p1 TRINITY_DN318_c0_g1~~TRINITY_DN318_c0_g1_i1.p1  ORF type:complete len:493 (-),score=172.02 TRINITY_DN318_c0_g1_i1:1-1479(-)
MSNKFVPFDGEIIEDDLIDEYDEEGQYNPPIPQHTSFESTPAPLRTPPTKAANHVNKSASIQPFDTEDPVLASAYDEENPTFFQSFITDKTRFNILVITGALLILLMMGILAAIFVTSFFVGTTNTDNSSFISLRNFWSSHARVVLPGDAMVYEGRGYFFFEHSQMRVDFVMGGTSHSYIIDEDNGYYVENQAIGTCTYSSGPAGRLSDFLYDFIRFDPAFQCHLFQVLVKTGRLYLCTGNDYIVTLKYTDYENPEQNVEMFFSEFVDEIPDDVIFEPADCVAKQPSGNESTPKFMIKDSWVSDIEVIYGDLDKSGFNTTVRNGKMWVDIQSHSMKISTNFTEYIHEIIHSGNKAISSSIYANGDCEYELTKFVEDNSTQTFIEETEFRGTKCNLFLKSIDDSLESICVSPDGEFVYLNYVNTTNADGNQFIYATNFREEEISSKTFSVAKGCKKKVTPPAIRKRFVEEVDFMQTTHHALANQEARLVRRRK